MADGIGGLTGKRGGKTAVKMQGMIASAIVAYAIIIDTIYT
jgi:hypothetical protein